ncbi:MAG: hypothetical protein CVT70_08845 [Alphaproteobacteria bacterium HGW-Alphaproteobacteria-1]|jgi:hypothetical protein|nr:MAG: hypothetical protein CVT70_08845 [Alphaproteobacteria bacterium HGW-Alphaproteobacteria-1]
MKTIVDLSMTACRRMGTSVPPAGLDLSFTSGGPLPDLINFTRSSAATYTDAGGTIRTAAVNEARVGHHIRQDGAWRRRLLVEPQSTNVLLHSADLTNAAWTGRGDFTVTPATSVIEGQTAHRFTNLGVTPSRAVTQTSGALTGSPETFSVIIERDTSETSVIGLRNQTTSTWVYAITVNFDTLAATAFSGAGQHRVTDLGIGPNGGRLLRVSLTGTGIAGNIRRVFIYPSGTSTNTNASIIHHVQLEARNGSTSVIVTAGSQATRAADLAQIDAGAWPFSMGGFSVAMEGEVTYEDNDLSTEARLYSALLDGTHYALMDIQTNVAPPGRLAAIQRTPAGNDSTNSGATVVPPGVNMPFSIAVRHSATDVQFALSGGLFTSAAAGLTDLAGAPFRIAPVGAVTVERLRIWGSPLTDAHLEEASQ